MDPDCQLDVIGDHVVCLRHLFSRLTVRLHQQGHYDFTCNVSGADLGALILIGRHNCRAQPDGTGDSRLTVREVPVQGDAADQQARFYEVVHAMGMKRATSAVRVRATDAVGFELAQPGIELREVVQAALGRRLEGGGMLPPTLHLTRQDLERALRLGLDGHPKSPEG